MMRPSILSLTAPLVVALVAPMTARAQAAAPSASLVSAESPLVAARRDVGSVRHHDAPDRRRRGTACRR